MLCFLLTLAAAAARVGGEFVRLVSDGPVMLDAPIVFTGRSAERGGGVFETGPAATESQRDRPLPPPPPPPFREGKEQVLG
jgi:hypothetical protein